MKKFVFTAALLLSLISGATFAQATDVDSRAAALTRDMSAKLALNESGYIKLKNVNREQLAKVEEITNMYKNDQAMRTAKLAELQKSYDAQLQGFLNSKQLEAYAAYKSSNSNFTALDADKK